MTTVSSNNGGRTAWYALGQTWRLHVLVLMCSTTIGCRSFDACPPGFEAQADECVRATSGGTSGTGGPGMAGSGGTGGNGTSGTGGGGSGGGGISGTGGDGISGTGGGGTGGGGTSGTGGGGTGGMLATISFESVPTLTAPTPVAEEAFGESVALTNDGWLAVGAPGTGDPAAPSGSAVYLFRKGAQDWEFAQEIENATPTFGTAVAFTDANILLVTDREASTVSCFRESSGTWSRVGNPVFASGSPSEFGASIAVDGNRVAFGAPSTSSRGAVYTTTTVGDCVSSTMQIVLPPSEVADANRFGISVSLGTIGGQDALVVGHNYLDASMSGFTTFLQPASAWGFASTTDLRFGENQARFTAAGSIVTGGQSFAGLFGTTDGSSWSEIDSQMGGLFLGAGLAGAASVPVIVSGAPGNTTADVFIEMPAGLSRAQRLSGQGGSFYGISVALDDDANTLAIGAPDFNGGTKSGAVYLYERSE